MQLVLAIISKIIDMIGIAILLYGFSKSLIKYVWIESRNLRSTPVRALQSIRCEIGIYILLALDFLIASDILHTIIHLSQEQLIELSAMIVLRTVIGYFLGREIQEIESHSKKQ